MGMTLERERVDGAVPMRENDMKERERERKRLEGVLDD